MFEVYHYYVLFDKWFRILRQAEDFWFTLATYMGIIEVCEEGCSERKVRRLMTYFAERIKRLKKFIMAGS